MITLVVAVVCLIIGLVLGTVIQVAYPQHPREMWRGFKAHMTQYMQGYEDIRKRIEEQKNDRRNLY